MKAGGGWESGKYGSADDSNSQGVPKWTVSTLPGEAQLEMT